MDEPTTRLDPSTRRHLWNIISDAKKGRCVVLTTHAMVEADVLADRIGIMSLGNLKRLGTPLHLKNKFGEGYRVELTLSASREADAIAFIRSRVVSTFVGFTTLEVPRHAVRLSVLFSTIESEKAAHGVRDWGISQTSLEDVFLEIVRNEEITPSDNRVA